MCWESNKVEKPFPIIADNDIPVIKIVIANYKTCDRCISKFMTFVYEKDRLYSNDIPLRITSKSYFNKWIIFEGFHSYSCKNKLRIKDDAMVLYGLNKNDILDIGSPLNEFSLALFIIPKESEYYENKHGEIVSNQIIFKKIILFDDDLLKKNKCIKTINLIK